MFDPYVIRQDFPILGRSVHGKRLIYFDNAATTHKPRQVIDVLVEFYTKHYANIHRGYHTLSQEASELYESAHDVVAKFIGASSWDEIVFTGNTTDSSNILAYSWGMRNLKEGDEIILTVMDHHSNMLPWRKIAAIRGARVKYVDITSDGVLDYADLEEKVSERTKVIAFPIMSNVLGTINDAKRIAKIAHSVGAIAVADGAQSVPHMVTNVRQMDVDFLLFSGHKMLGPTGIGVLWGRKDLLEEMEPFKVGGGTIEDVTLDNIVWESIPWRFEAGTPNIAGAIGLAEAVKYLSKIGMNNVEKYEKELVKYTFDKIRELGDEIDIYGPSDLSLRGGIVSFNLRGIHHHVVGMLLDTYGVAVRTGMHCAHPLHYRLGLKGTVRASYYIYNIREEIDVFIDALRDIIKRRAEFGGGFSNIDSEKCTSG